MRLAIVALCAPLAYCATHRTVTARPALALTVVDARGAPIPGADVVIHWWSYPHRHLDGSFPLTAGPDGRVTSTHEARTERIMPMCMHGVPAHHHTVCAGATGHGWTAVQLDGSETTLTIQLPGGGYARECADFRAVERGPVSPDAGAPPAAAR